MRVVRDKRRTSALHPRRQPAAVESVRQPPAVGMVGRRDPIAVTRGNEIKLVPDREEDPNVEVVSHIAERTDSGRVECGASARSKQGENSLPDTEEEDEAHFRRMLQIEVVEAFRELAAIISYSVM